MADRIYLSPPHMGSLEFPYVEEAFATNWIAPVGPHLNAFEQEMQAYIGGGQCVALSSGTAALHLALVLAGVGPGDEVLCSSLTFAASANPVVYLGAQPVFLDSEAKSWNLDPQLLADCLKAKAAAGKLPKALIVVDLYGQCADYEPIRKLCKVHGVLIIEDSAEALGADYQGTKAGLHGDFGVFSFNGNKIITTSGGGMLVCQSEEAAQQARKLSTQARDPAMHYQHSEIGYNYRMSNVLAGIGRGQLKMLEERIAARYENLHAYQEAFADLPVSFMPDAGWGRGNRWLACVLLNPEVSTKPHAICEAMDAANIEARPIWKPLHLQPVFADREMWGGAVSEDLFARGICLPSGSAMGDAGRQRVIDCFRECVSA